MARSSECTEQYAQKVFDSAGIVREAMLRQPRFRVCDQGWKTKSPRMDRD